MEQEVENNDLSASSPNKTGTNGRVQKRPANGDFMRLRRCHRPKSMFPASEPDHRSPSCESLGQEGSGEVKRWEERGKSASVRAWTPVEPPGWGLFLVYRPLPVGTAGRRRTLSTPLAKMALAAATPEHPTEVVHTRNQPKHKDLRPSSGHMTFSLHFHWWPL